MYLHKVYQAMDSFQRKSENVSVVFRKFKAVQSAVNFLMIRFIQAHRNTHIHSMYQIQYAFLLSESSTPSNGQFVYQSHINNPAPIASEIAHTKSHHAS